MSLSCSQQRTLPQESPDPLICALVTFQDSPSFPVPHKDVGAPLHSRLDESQVSSSAASDHQMAESRLAYLAASCNKLVPLFSSSAFRLMISTLMSQPRVRVSGQGQT